MTENAKTANGMMIFLGFALMGTVCIVRILPTKIFNATAMNLRQAKSLKIRGLTVNIDENKSLGFLMTGGAVKEFCKYHNIPYEESKGGAVTTMKAGYHGAMLREFWEIITNNNWRKMHHLPMVRRKDKSRAFVEDLSAGECDKYKPYKNKNVMPYKIDREILFEIDDFETVDVTSLEDDTENARRYIKGRKNS